MFGFAEVVALELCGEQVVAVCDVDLLDLT